MDGGLDTEGRFTTQIVWRQPGISGRMMGSLGVGIVQPDHAVLGPEHLSLGQGGTAGKQGDPVHTGGNLQKIAPGVRDGSRF